MDEGFAKIPPHSLEAEQSVIGAMILDKDNISLAAESLKEEDFYIEAHKIIYSAVMDLFNMDKPIDLVTVSDKLQTSDRLDAVGGVAYLSQIALGVPTTSNLPYYIKIISDKSMLRKLIKAANSVISISYDDYNDTSEIVDQATKCMFDVLEGKNSSAFSHIYEVLLETHDRLEKLRHNKGSITGVPTGFRELDIKTSGWQKSDLILLAARPAMGKTSLALNLVEHAAINHDICVAVFSLEMSKEQLVSRVISSTAGINSSTLRTGELTDQDWIKIAQAFTPLSRAPLYIDDTANITISEIRAKCRRLKHEKNLGLVVIDYLQLMESHGKRENRQQEISAISRSLKILAKELDVPIITLSQLSRAPDQRPDHKPQLSDLRESGAIEQDADIVMFLYRDEVYNEDTEEKGVAECIIAKHRSGSTGSIKLGWQGEYTRFVGLARD